MPEQNKYFQAEMEKRRHFEVLGACEFLRLVMNLHSTMIMWREIKTMCVQMESILLLFVHVQEFITEKRQKV